MTIPTGMFLRGKTWYTRKDVPKPLRAILGKTSCQHRLGTDFKQAVILHYRMMAECE